MFRAAAGGGVVADEEKSLAELDKAMFAAEAHDPVDGGMDLLRGILQHRRVVASNHERASGVIWNGA